MNFYAVKEDRAIIFDYIFNNTDLKIYEEYSECDREIVLYESIECIEHKIDTEMRISQFVLYSKNLGGKLGIRKINLNPNPQGHKIRYVSEGWGSYICILERFFTMTICREINWNLRILTIIVKQEPKIGLQQFQNLEILIYGIGKQLIKNRKK